MTATSSAVAIRGRRLLAGATVAAVLVPASAVLTAGTAEADSTYVVPASRTLVIRGHGYGHGRGMSQYGAQGAALQGLGYSKILSFYYPGTSVAAAKGWVRVLLSADSTSDVQVRPQTGLRVRDLRDRATWTLPAKEGITRWRLVSVPNGTTAVQYHTSTGWHRWSVPDGRGTFRSNGAFFSPGRVMTLLVPSSHGLVERRYRGGLRSVRPYPGATARDTVNQLTVDAYVRGVVPNEMPTSWKASALRAQAVAARTYAAWQRAQNPDRYYQICDTTACQVYGGADAEQPSSNAAVEATAQQILTYAGQVARTEFSASSGGWTAAGGLAYLKAKRDSFDNFSGNPVHTWRVKVNAASLERAHPAIGRLKAIRVTARDGNGEWNGRVLQLVLEGRTGTARMTGDAFRWHYGLRSTWFTFGS